MAERRFKPGHRNKRFQEGRIGENRLAWLQSYIGQFIVMHYDEPPEDSTEDTVEPGDTVRLGITGKYGRTSFYNITALTEEELNMLRQLFELMFEVALPIVQERDKVAQDAYDRGDDSYARSYRTPPRLVVRERAKRADGEGVQQRPDLDAEGHEPDGDPDGGLREGGGDLADELPSSGVAEDDQQADD